VVRQRRYRRLALELMTEAVAVGNAEGIALEKSGTLDLDWIALSASDRSSTAFSRLTAKHALLRGRVGYRRMRSSMLAAIERGRTPASIYLNGEVVTRGTKHGIDTKSTRACARPCGRSRRAPRSRRARRSTRSAGRTIGRRRRRSRRTTLILLTCSRNTRAHPDCQFQVHPRSRMP